MTEWFKNQEGDVTHFCLGVPTNEEVIDRFTEKGVFGNIKHKDTSTKLSMWFHPTTLEEGTPVCRACGLKKPEDAEFVLMGEPNDNR